LKLYNSGSYNLVTYLPVTFRFNNELYDKMLELYPNRVPGWALWSSARAVKQ